MRDDDNHDFDFRKYIKLKYFTSEELDQPDEDDYEELILQQWKDELNDV